MAFDKKLLDVVACPVCKGKLLFNPQQQALICRFDRLSYPVREGIPVLIEEKATQLTLDEIEALK
ncbi:Trm112 family protein [Alteromonas aestuariivivens]|uniref:UPF0434 protein DXV75_08405 n=1 Tax=Alteromonas aestuariivivens TaxID=1938339 RepID=A0A3D8M880_9ALTE|nr:Trm112 family protein [Alteromonas aestuariivivens]RDV26091.1 Trm112 family protein [Alteromonas aestuariivivens]